MKKIVIITPVVMMVFMTVCAREKPTLEHGKSFIETPVIREGLCLHNLFQSGMVIQRDKPIRIWGWGTPGETVTVSLAGKTAQATAAKDRSWRVELPAMAANGKGRTMIIKGKNKTLTLNNILIGDVWIVGGQSNMQLPLSNIESGQTEIISAHFPNIRLLTVPAMIDNQRKQNFPEIYRWENRHYREGYWDVCSPETVRDFSAIGYIFARRLHMASQVPIGVIDASRWGTTVEAWTPLTDLRKIGSPVVNDWLAEWDKKVADYDPQKALAARIKQYNDRTERLKKDGGDVSGRQPPTAIPPSPVVSQNYPGNCYASLIAPLAGFPVKGAIYHQGFNNSRFDAAEFYYQVFPVMIAAWRAAFNDPTMPFGIISLCTDSAPQTLENYTECMFNFGIYVREAQYKTFLDLYNAGDKNIGFASSFDLRRAWYHPHLKAPAAERIARWALATQYGFAGNIHWKPPMVTRVDVQDDKILVHVDTEVASVDSQAIAGFAIAGPDKKYEPARAESLVVGKDGRGRPKYDRKMIVLSSPNVPHPIHYRYAWGRNPMGNLRIASVAQKDIPFATQRSDTWKFWEVPFVAPLPDQKRSRLYDNKIREALKLVDLERHVNDATRAAEELKQNYLKTYERISQSCADTEKNVEK